jgi:hypothetical protein
VEAEAGAVPVPQDRHVHYLDWLKVLIVYGILFFHVALVFSGPIWLVGNRESIPVLAVVAGFCFPWGIPAMFLISGADSWFGLRSRSARDFMRGRFLRLVLPLAVGIVLLSPFQRYIASAQPPPPLGGLPGFYGKFFREMRLEWTPRWLGTYGLHLWFLGYLFAITAVCLPILEWLRRPHGKRILAGVAEQASRRGGLFLLGVPLAVSQLLLRPRFPLYQDWADIATYTIVFLMGAVMGATRAFEPAIRRHVHTAVAAGIVASFGVGSLLFVDWLHIPRSPAASTLREVSFALLWSLNIWCWLIAVLYIGVRWLDHPNKIVSYANESVLPFYVVHHPVVITVAAFVVTWALPAWVKFPILLVTSLAITVGIYDLGIRRWNFMRMLFGLKPLHRTAPQPGPELEPAV